jgi:uncharacterized protein
VTAHIHQVILKVAERCNLNCSYCYMYHGVDQSYRSRPRFMSEEIYLRTLLMLRGYCANHDSSMSLSFHGGEPTLCGVERLDRWFTIARTVLGERLDTMSLQTNGTLIDDEWLALFAEHEIALGISIDGPAAVHDVERVDHANRGSHARVEAALLRILRAGLEPLVLAVVRPGSSGSDIYRYFRSLGVRRLDFLIPDVTHEGAAALRARYGATPIADVLLPAFDAYLAEDDPSVEIRLFKSMISQLAGVPSGIDAFGNRPASYLVVESDGAIEGNDVFKICDTGVVATPLNVLTHSFDDITPKMGFLGRFIHQGLPLPRVCRTCRWRVACAGGYPPHRYARDNGFDNQSAWCADLMAMFDHLARVCFRTPVAQTA